MANYSDTVIEKPNYVYENGRFKAYLSLEVPYEKGLGLAIEDVIRIFDTTVINGCSIYYITYSKNLNDNYVVKKIGEFRKVAFNEDNEKQDQNQKHAPKKEKSDKEKRVEEKVTNRHRNWYREENPDHNAKVVGFKVDVMVVADELGSDKNQLELLSRQILAIQDNFDGVSQKRAKDKLKGVSLGYYTGSTLKAMNSIFEGIDDKDNALYTSTQSNYSGLDFYINTSLKDDNGFIIGTDHFSNIKSSTLVDFVGTTNKKGVIAIPKDRSSKSIVYNNGEIVPTASVLSQVASNQFAFVGKKVVHFVLNDYDYSEVKGAKAFDPEYCHKVDVSQIAINPLQLEGDRDNQAVIFDNIKAKIVHLLDVASQFTLSPQARADLSNAVASVLSRNHWSYSATVNRADARLVGQNSLTFPTMKDVLVELRTNRQSRDNSMTDHRRDSLNLLISTLDGVYGANQQLIGRNTDFTPPSAPQTFYEFNKVGGNTLKAVQLINIINNIGNTLDSGDLIVIHGMDCLDERVTGRIETDKNGKVIALYNDYLKKEIDLLQKRGVKFIFSFDNTTKAENGGSTIFDLEYKMYLDFREEIDWSFFGYVPEEDFKRVVSLFKSDFTDSMKNVSINENYYGRGFFSRKSTATLHYCSIAPVI